MHSAVRVRTQVYRRIYYLARLWVRGLLAVAGALMLGIISILLGLSPAPQTVPVVTVVRQSPGVALAVGGFVLFATITAFQISRAPVPHGDDISEPDLSAGWHLPRLLISTAVSTISTTLLIALLSVVLVRPPWCPTALCPTPRTIVVTNPHGIHDSNLEVYFTALQSDTFVIPGDPATYSLSDTPETIGALRIDTKTLGVYRVVLGVHSLQQGRFGMLITQVALVITQMPPIPRPLNVWVKGAPLTYTSDPFLAMYRGQQAGDTIAAFYTPLPGTHIQLAPGEADEVDLQVASHVPVDLRFQIQVTYRVTNESAEHTLTLPSTFEVVFSDASNWHPYHLQQDGRLVPAT